MYRGITGCCSGRLPRTATARGEGQELAKKSCSILFSEQRMRLWGFQSTSSTRATTPCFWLCAEILDIFIEYCEFLPKFSFLLVEKKKKNNVRDTCPIHCQEFLSLLIVLETEGRAPEQELGHLGGPWESSPTPLPA